MARHVLLYIAAHAALAVGIVVVDDTCLDSNNVAITFDDGPYIYSSQVSAAFTAAGGNVTFFVNGYNYDCIYVYSTELQSAAANGHQIG